MIRLRDIEFIESAIRLAEDNRNPKGYTMVSMLCKGKRMLSVGINSYTKTHPNQPQIRNYTISTHAEVKAISRHIVKCKPISKDMTIYVAGITRNPITNCCVSSLPCESCMSFITTVGIKRIVYATNDNNGFNIFEQLLV